LQWDIELVMNRILFEYLLAYWAELPLGNGNPSCIAMKIAGLVKR
jgi:hypothetical protein